MICVSNRYGRISRELELHNGVKRIWARWGREFVSERGLLEREARDCDMTSREECWREAVEEDWLHKEAE